MHRTCIKWFTSLAFQQQTPFDIPWAASLSMYCPEYLSRQLKCKRSATENGIFVCSNTDPNCLIEWCCIGDLVNNFFMDSFVSVRICDRSQAAGDTFEETIHVHHIKCHECAFLTIRMSISNVLEKLNNVNHKIGRDLYVGVRQHTKHSTHYVCRIHPKCVCFNWSARLFICLFNNSNGIAMQMKRTHLPFSEYVVQFQRHSVPQQLRRTHSIFDAWHERTIPLPFIVLFDNLIISNYFHGIHN